LKVFVGTVFFFSIFLGLSIRAEAASLSLVSVGGAVTVSVGQLFSVNAVASTVSGEAMNAVSGTVSFPPSALQLVSIDKTGSIVNFWIGEPSISNTSGQAKFEGGIYNPGYTGAQGKVATMLFRAKTAGTVDIAFLDASILANDGLGTNILTQAKPLRLTVIPAAQVPVSQPTTSTPEVIVSVNPPTFDRFPVLLTQGDVLLISGSAAKNSTVKLFLDGSDGYSHEQSTRTGDDGRFQAVWNGELATGAYGLTAEVTTARGVSSLRSPELAVTVQSNVLVRTTKPVIDYALIFIVVAGIAFLCALWTWYLLHGFGRFRRKIRSDVKKTGQLIHVEFKRILESVHGKRKLTAEEERIMDMIKKVEEDIEKDLKEIGR
jgi:hypothetical protein